MIRKPNCLYVATDGNLFKIGISAYPVSRVKSLGPTMRLIRFWRRPYARRMEACVKSMFDYCRAAPHLREWFKISEKEFFSMVCRVVRIEDDDYLIRHGMKPSDRNHAIIPPTNLPRVRNRRKSK